MAEKIATFNDISDHISGYTGDYNKCMTLSDLRTYISLESGGHCYINGYDYMSDSVGYATNRLIPLAEIEFTNSTVTITVRASNSTSSTYIGIYNAQIVVGSHIYEMDTEYYGTSLCTATWTVPYLEDGDNASYMISFEVGYRDDSTDAWRPGSYTVDNGSLTGTCSDGDTIGIVITISDYSGLSTEELNETQELNTSTDE